jgi:hypothetical protein
MTLEAIVVSEPADRTTRTFCEIAADLGGQWPGRPVPEWSFVLMANYDEFKRFMDIFSTAFRMPPSFGVTVRDLGGCVPPHVPDVRDMRTHRAVYSPCGWSNQSVEFECTPEAAKVFAAAINRTAVLVRENSTFEIEEIK